MARRFFLNRVQFPSLVGAILLLAGLPCIAQTTVTRSAATPTTSPLPNILWISIEDFSPDFSFYGDNHAHTPNINRLAKAGCVYTRAFSTSPICAPSRSTLITGIYAATLGTQNMRTNVPLPPDIKPFPYYLRQAGYYCTNNLKTDYNFTAPAGTWDESSGRAHWRKRPNPDQPFFAVFNLTITHEGKYKLPPRRYNALIKDLPEKYKVDPDSVTPPSYFPNTPVTRADWARHYDIASQMDIEAGHILKQLDDDGLTSNTIIFFFSDHGVGLPRSKRWLYDAGLHVPLVIKWPGVIKAGTRNEELVSLMDFAPTLLSITGNAIPSAMQGRIILGNAKQPEPKFLFATRDRVDETVEYVRSVRDHRFRYIRNFLPDQPYSMASAYADGNPTMKEMRRMDKDGTLTGPATLMFQPRKPKEELYDTQADPENINNLADDPAHKETLATMRNALEQWQKDINDKGRQPEPEDERKRASEQRAKRKEE